LSPLVADEQDAVAPSPEVVVGRGRGFLAAVVPEEFHRRHVAPGGMLPDDPEPVGVGLVAAGLALGLGREGVAEFERPCRPGTRCPSPSVVPRSCSPAGTTCDTAGKALGRARGPNGDTRAQACPERVAWDKGRAGRTTRGPRGPARWLPTGRVRRLGGSWRLRGSGCPSGWRPWPPGRSSAPSWPHRPSVRGAFRNRRVCPTSSPRCSRRRGCGRWWSRRRRRRPWRRRTSCASRGRSWPSGIAWPLRPGCGRSRRRAR